MQFRALSDQLYRTPDHHAWVRGAVVWELRAHPERYMSFVSDSLAGFMRYCAYMERDGTWGDHGEWLQPISLHCQCC